VEARVVAEWVEGRFGLKKGHAIGTLVINWFEELKRLVPTP